MIAGTYVGGPSEIDVRVELRPHSGSGIIVDWTFPGYTRVGKPRLSMTPGHSQGTVTIPVVEHGTGAPRTLRWENVPLRAAFGEIDMFMVPP